jgi:hypothetical protein
MPSPSATRAAAVSAVLFGLSFFLTVASVNVPHTSSDATLLAWWERSANVSSGLLSLLFATCTAVLFAVVANYLLTQADRTGLVQTTAFARSMSTAFTCTLLVSAALRGVIGHLVQAQDEPLPGVDVLRYSTALNYTVIGTVVMGTFALTVLALAVVVLRAGILARWVGYVGLGCGALVLAASAALVGQYTVPVAIVWALATAVAIWRQPVEPTPEVAPAPAETAVQ